MESCDPPGRELEIARLVQDELVACGIEAELDEFEEGRANVLGRVRGTGAKPSLVFSAHLDTVPVGTQPWSFPPFSGEVRDGRMLGRGASDMKSAVAAMMSAAVALAGRATPLAGDLLLAFSAGESSNCVGAKRFVAQGLRQEMGALLVGEPSSMDVVVVEKAVLWLRAEAVGRIGHVSGDAGVNAIDLMLDFLVKLRSVELPCEPHQLLDGPTVRVGRIAGGSAVNVTPDICTAEIDIRLPPGFSPDRVIAAIEALAPPGIAAHVSDFKPAVESDPRSAFVQACRNACRSETSREPCVRGVSYYSDATILSAGTDIPFAIIGPGEIGMSGQPDESVSVPNVVAAARIYQLIAERWLGEAPS